MPTQLDTNSQRTLEIIHHNYREPLGEKKKKKKLRQRQARPDMFTEKKKSGAIFNLWKLKV